MLALEDADPTLVGDEPSNEDMPPSDDLPPLVPSTNPLFPNAVVKRPPNTHARVSMKPKPPPVDVVTEEEEATAPGATASAAEVVMAAAPMVAKEPSTPKIPGGKNGPVSS